MDMDASSATVDEISSDAQPVASSTPENEQNLNFGPVTRRRSLLGVAIAAAKRKVEECGEISFTLSDPANNTITDLTESEPKRARVDNSQSQISTVEKQNSDMENDQGTRNVENRPTTKAIFTISEDRIQMSDGNSNLQQSRESILPTEDTRTENQSNEEADEDVALRGSEIVQYQREEGENPEAEEQVTHVRSPENSNETPEAGNSRCNIM
ncbi:hypothetical protein ACLKA7_003394 [Drosophila subpalustris]